MRAIDFARTVFLCAIVFTTTASADGNELVVQQIGSDNRSAAWQGQAPSAAEAGAAVGVDPDALSFDVRDAGNPTGGVQTRSLTELIDEFEGLPGGNDNTARLIQQGRRNRAIQIQAGGSDNRMLTEQHGSDNVAVHLQRGSDNNTEMIQNGNGNETALIATGGARGSDGGALRLQASQGVKGFAVRASGQQSYATISVTPNISGGFNISMTQ